MVHIAPPLCYPLPYSLFAHMLSLSLIVIALVLNSPFLYLVYIAHNRFLPHTPCRLSNLLLINLMSLLILLGLFDGFRIAQMVMLISLSFLFLLSCKKVWTLTTSDFEILLPLPFLFLPFSFFFFPF